MHALDSSPWTRWTRLGSPGFGERVCLTIDALFDEWDK